MMLEPLSITSKNPFEAMRLNEIQSQLDCAFDMPKVQAHLPEFYNARH
jgi:hypothetical protein